MLIPVIVQAAPAPNSRGRVQSIKKGQVAPFDGVIYDTKAHALLVSKTKAFQDRLKVELDFLKQKMILQCDAKTRSLKIDLETMTRKLQLETQARHQQKNYLLDQLSKKTKTPWYREPMFTFSMGFLVCALVTGLSVYAFQSVRK